MTFRHYIKVGLLFLSAGLSSYGQSTFATITGSVTDPSGAVLANAKIQARETTRVYKFDVTTNADSV